MVASEDVQATQAAPAPQAAAPVTIEVWHDAVCPWCRIGLHNLQRAIAAAGRPVDLQIHPFLLDPTTPDEGRDLRGWLGARYGAARVEAMFANVTSAGARYGVTFHFDKIRQSPSTVRAHATIAAVPAAVRDAYVHAMHVAYFERGEDIGSPEVLGALAESAGWSRAEAIAAANDAARLAAVRQAADAASRSGIRGVPHFVIGGQPLHGAQSPEAMQAAIAAAR